MKRYSAFASIFVLLAVLIFTPCSRVSAAEIPADGMTGVLTKGDLSFYANAENGEVALINTESGISWKSNPDFPHYSRFFRCRRALGQRAKAAYGRSA